MKALTPALLTQDDRSLRLLRLAFPAFRPQPRLPSTGRFTSRLSAGGCFQASPRMSRLATASRRIRFVILRTASSPPVALHPASRRRSYLRLRRHDTLLHGLPPCQQSVLTDALMPGLGPGIHELQRKRLLQRPGTALSPPITAPGCAELGVAGPWVLPGGMGYRCSGTLVKGYWAGHYPK